MYPVLRLANEHRRFRKSAPLGLFDTHVSHHLCWPHDLDPWMELNNGRTLTLYDFGRTVLFRRIGMVPVFKARGWGGTVAGSSVRYRKRVRAWERIEMRSRFVGWDARVFYVTQGMWRQGEGTSHALFRVAVTSGTGLVPAAEVAQAGGGTVSPPLPGWIAAWIAAEGERPWPPD